MKAHHDIDIAWHRHGHAIAGANAGIRESSRGARRKRIELGVGHALRSAYEKLAVGMLFERLRKRISNRSGAVRNRRERLRPEQLAKRRVRVEGRHR